MKIQFKLRHPQSKGETLVYLLTYIKGERLVYSTGESINPKYWDTENQRAIIPRKTDKETADHCRDVNTIIENSKTNLTKAKTELIELEIPVNASNLRERLDKRLNKSTIRQTQFLRDYLKTFIDQIDKGERVTDKGNKFAIGTITAYNSTLKHIENFEKEKRIKLRFEKLSKDIYSKYTAFLTTEYEPNTIGKDIKNIKAICRNAEAEGIKVNPLVFTYFKTIKIDTDAVYLNENELQAIQELDLNERPGLENARDLFLIMCYTGLRFSDLKKLKIEHFSKDLKFIRLYQKKTGGKLQIPVHYIVNDIIDKRGGLPHIISNVKLNVYIKDICELAKINEPIFVQYFEKGLRIEKNKPKYKLVTVHTARRSFATNMYKSKQLTVQEIMLFTGHKTEASFFRYIKVTKEEMAERLSNIDFFKRPLQVAK